MKIYGAYLKTVEGDIHFNNVTLNDEIYEGTHVVSIKGRADNYLDENLAATFVFDPENVSEYMCDYRHAEYWCRPFFGKELWQVHYRTQGMIYKKTDGSWGAVLPVVSSDYKCELYGSERGAEAKLFSWCKKLKECNAPAFVWCEGDNPYNLMSLCAKAAAKYLGGTLKTIDERKYPEIFEYLGWCSWDAMQIRVNEEGLIEKCEEFAAKKIPVKWMIIDDMWGDVHEFYGAKYQTRQDMFKIMHSGTLYDFAADPFRFPDGLKTTIERINKRGVKVGMWHPTTGYWSGVTKDGPLAESQKDNLMLARNGCLIPTYETEKAYKFYSAFHDFLKNSGVEFVKIDNQSMTNRFYREYESLGSVARQFHAAIEKSVSEHFGGQMINCMGMASEDMFNRSDSPISRCSDDFQPDDREWFRKHIQQCSYICLLHGQFYFEDWDMWWSHDGQAIKNSVIRAISGGPVYVSDELGKSKAEVLMPLVMSDGRILRCDRPATPTRDCLTVDPRTNPQIFKLQNTCGEAGVIAAFDLRRDEGKETGFISPAEVEGIKGDEFAVYEHFSREFKIMKRDDKLAVTLESSDHFKLFIIVPLKDGNCVIGRTDKFISPKTVKPGEQTPYEPGPYAYVKDRKIYFVD
ncbi:MAG: alpha-galactosidase [Clostridia bacterium]|nr:alpha-galactosidase [Clostridia bacterium]